MVTLDGEYTAEFETTGNLDLGTGMSLTAWIADHMGDLITQDERAALLRPLTGRQVDDWWGDDDWQVLMRNIESPEWDRWIAKHPEAFWVAFRRIDRALARSMSNLYADLVAPPGDGKAPPYYLYARARLLLRLGQEETGLHDLEIVAAQYPGFTIGVWALAGNWRDHHLIRSKMVSVFERWHRQMPPAPMWDLILAQAHLTASESWDRSDAPGSRESNRAKARYHNDAAAELVQRAFERGGPLPYTLGMAQRATTSYRDTGWFEGYFRRVIDAYPGSITPYRSALRVLIRRNSRTSTESQRSFIAQTLERRPDWLHAAQLFDDYLLGFDGVIGQLEREGIEGDITGTVLRNWLGERGEWKDLAAAVARHILRNDPTETGAARAAAQAWLAGDDDFFREIARDYPRLVFGKNMDFGNVVRMSEIRHPLLNALRRNDQLDVAFEYTSDLFENHRECCLDKWSSYQVEHAHAHHALLLGFMGRGDEAEVFWEKAGTCSCLNSVRVLSWAVSGQRTDEVRDHIARHREEGRRVGEIIVAEIVLLARHDDIGEARALAESRRVLTGNYAPYLKRIVRETLGEPDGSI